MAELILVLLGCGAAWVIGLLLWPYSPCNRCEGSGRNAGSNSRRWGPCSRCKGSGRRLRAGARLARWIILRKDV
jgi:hypothetical protein